MLVQMNENRVLTTSELIAGLDNGTIKIEKTQRPYKPANAKMQVAKILAVANQEAPKNSNYKAPTYDCEKLCFAYAYEGADAETFDGQHRGRGCSEFSKNKWGLPRHSDEPLVNDYLINLYENFAGKGVIKFKDLPEKDRNNFLNFQFIAEQYVSPDRDERSQLLIYKNSGMPLKAADFINNRYAFHKVTDIYNELAECIKKDANRLDLNSEVQQFKFCYPSFLRPSDYANYEKTCRLFADGVSKEAAIRDALFRFTMRRWKADTSKALREEFFMTHSDDKKSERVLINGVSKTLKALAYASEILPDNVRDLSIAVNSFCYWVAGAENSALDTNRTLKSPSDRNIAKVKDAFQLNILKWKDTPEKEDFILNGVVCPVKITSNKFNYLSNTAYKWERTKVFSEVLDFIFTETLKEVI